MIKFLTKMLLPLVIIGSAGCSGSEDGNSAASDQALVECAVYPQYHYGFIQWEINNDNPFGKISGFGMIVTQVLDAIEQTGVKIPLEVRTELSDDDYRAEFLSSYQSDLTRAANRLKKEVNSRHAFITGQCALINANYKSG